MKTTKYDFFISYRRSGNIDAVHILVSVLRDLGYTVFLDLDKIGAGNFEENILSAISNCTYFLPIITEGCFDRCNDDEDWLYKELIQAHQTKRTIVPIILPNATIPSKKLLPQKIEFIASQNGVAHTPNEPKNTVKNLLILLNQNTQENLSKLFGIDHTLENTTKKKNVTIPILVFAMVLASGYLYIERDQIKGMLADNKTLENKLEENTKDKDSELVVTKTGEPTETTIQKPVIIKNNVPKGGSTPPKKQTVIKDHSPQFRAQGFTYKCKGAFLDTIKGANTKEVTFEWVLPKEKVICILEVECQKDRLLEGESGLQHATINKYMQQWSTGLKRVDMPHEEISFNSNPALLYRKELEEASMLGVFFLGKDKWYKLKVVGPEKKLKKALNNFESSFALL